MIPVRRGYWGAALGDVHTVPMKVSGRCGSVLCRLVPAPKGTGLVAAPTPKKLLTMAGIKDVYTNTSGSTKTLGNFAMATYLAMASTYNFLTPDAWAPTQFIPTPFQEYTDYLARSSKTGKVAVK